MNSAETIERVRIHADGAVRVAGTRVTLDTVVATFNAGATAEEIALFRPIQPDRKSSDRLTRQPAP